MFGKKAGTAKHSFPFTEGIDERRTRPGFLRPGTDQIINPERGGRIVHENIALEGLHRLFEESGGGHVVPGVLIRTVLKRPAHSSEVIGTALRRGPH
jgi:hypothetical protein